MEGRSYVSCIKINGIPILPPVMTKDIIDEMTYYKQLAIAVEKRLADQHAARQCHNNTRTEPSRKESKSKRTPLERAYSLNENDFVDDNATDIDVSLTTTTVIHMLTEGTNTITDSDISTKNSNGEIEDNAPWTPNSDEENKLENDIHYESSTTSRSQSISVSVDWSQSPGETVSAKSNIAETTTETWKPQVPKTLNIVPLTLDSPEYKVDERSENARDTPKLVRQGSYVLDSPSPMLIAHMQTELANSGGTPTSEYVPTMASSATRRKEWNIAQARVQWERSRDEDIVLTDYPKDSGKYNQNESVRTEPCTRRSLNREVKSEPPYGTYSSAKSVDCIQAMLAKEYIARTSVRNQCDRKHTSPASCEKSERSQKWKTRENCSILNLAQKLGGSLGNLNNVHTQYHRSTESEHLDRVPLNNGFHEETCGGRETQQPTKPKSSITTDKLLLVYKEIQKMHKKQMCELVSRQQREQSLLQKEFEKQQLLLLNEIKKSFPKIPISSIAENISSVARSQLVSDNESFSGNGCDALLRESRSPIIEQQAESDSTSPQNDHVKAVSCPLDYIYPAVPLHSTEECEGVKYSQSTQTLDLASSAKSSDFSTAASTKELEGDFTGIEDENCKLQDTERKRLSVSRQLFPLDSKTVHVPVLGNAIYDNKHIRAANVINAYARGYLVRRLMQTDRVIALKNTYKEALHCMLKLHVDAPLNRSEFHFLHRLQLQCDAASMNIVELFAQSPEKRMQIIAQDREIKRSRTERPTSARSYSFATQRTLARKKLKEYDSA